MGEYAIRISDNEQVKIGTCESMYYLRYEDRCTVRHLSGNVDPAKEKNLFWRLPFPDEDGVEPGNYDPYNRGLRLYVGKNTYYRNPELAEHPGIIQMHHDCGLLINVTCYHGEKFPDLGTTKCFWNGRGWFYELRFVKNTDTGVLPIIQCRHCEQMWRSSWEEILPYVGDTVLRNRLSVYQSI